MIHIATVHWQDATWVDIQLAYFNRYLSGHSYRIYAFLNGIDPEKYRKRIHFICTDPIQPHITKLNLLADRICTCGASDDILYFIDGDAFPIGDIHRYVRERLKIYPLVAIKRLENDGDPQPHPSFCATTIRFWREIKGDWGQGPQWKTSSGKLRTDTGGLLWDKLNLLGIDWAPMLRSNRVELHPLWFGIYGDLIYHHGAGFRTPYCMMDIRAARETMWKKLLMNFADSRIGTLGSGWIQNAIYSFVMKEQIRQTCCNSKRIIMEIQKNFDFPQIIQRKTAV